MHTCPVCQAPVPPKVPGTPGRQRVYCSRSCQAKRERVRARDPKPTIACTACGAPFLRTHADRTCCSRNCWYVSIGRKIPGPLPRRTCALPECDVEFEPKSGRQRCCCEAHGKTLDRRRRRAAGLDKYVYGDAQRDAYHRRRARKRAAETGRAVRRAEIAERDKWRCHICGCRVSRKAYPHPLSPSLDHLIPLSKGGVHDPSNVKLAHLRCNTLKGNRGGGEQLLLIG